MRNIRRIGIIGCGTIGLGWATFFSLKGLKINLYDEQADIMDNATGRIKINLEFLVSIGEINGLQYENALKNISIYKDLEQCIDAVDFIQESIYENYNAKKKLYNNLDQILEKEIIIASSSSGLLMTEIQKAVRNYPDRCVIGHPINPVYLIPLVEVVPGKETSNQTVQFAKEFYEDNDKVPVVLKKEVPGYLENRLTAALWREAIDLVVNDVASVEDVDKAIWAGPGLRYALLGPHLIYHLGGGEGGIKYFIDHLEEAFKQWWDDMNCWKELPKNASEKLHEGIVESMKGKSIKEISTWRDKKLVELLKVVDIKKNYPN